MNYKSLDIVIDQTGFIGIVQAVSKNGFAFVYFFGKKSKVPKSFAPGDLKIIDTLPNALRLLFLPNWASNSYTVDYDYPEPNEFHEKHEHCKSKVDENLSKLVNAVADLHSIKKDTI